MEFSEKFTSKYSEQIEENNKLRLLNNQKQEENMKLVFAVSLTKAEYEREQQMRNQFENQYNEANKVIEQVEISILKNMEFKNEDFFAGSFETFAKIKKLCIIS